MTKVITPKGKLSPKEAVKSARDAGLVILASLIPELLNILEVTDFGENQLFVTVLLAAIAPLVNRFLNFIRV